MGCQANAFLSRALAALLLPVRPAPARRCAGRSSAGRLSAAGLPAVRLRTLLGLLGLATLLTACATPPSGPPPQGSGTRAPTAPPASSPPRGGQRPLVLTTIAPITLFTRAVAGPCAEVRPLLPPGTGPHGFQSRPQDLLALRRAQVLVINGLGLEGFLQPLLRSAAPPSLRLIDSSRGVSTLAGEPPPLPREASSADQPHDDGQREEAGEHTSDPAHAEDGDHHHHGQAGGPNPHIWLDPLRAVEQVHTIRDGLIAADPRCAEGYRRRASAYADSLRTLDAELARQLRPLRGRSFVVLHDFAPYVAQRYGLRADFLVTSPEQAPSPADLRRISALVRRSGLRVLLVPPGETSGSFTNLARDLGLRLAPFSPMEVLSAAELADPGTYLRLQRGNAAALQRAFTP